MKRILEKIISVKNSIQNFFNEKFNNKISFPTSKNSNCKRYVINFLQTNVMFVFALLIFAVVMRPFALDIAEMHGISRVNEDNSSEDQSFEESQVEENPFPFSVIKPQEGTQRRLTRAEMRWIFKEELRLNAMKRVIDMDNERACKAFSVMVRDFNVRGANFQYEFCDKIRAQEDVNKFKEEIEREAMDEAIEYGWGQL